MKKLLLSGLLMAILFAGCKKENTTNNNPPVTNFDHSSGGVYKGVFIGSSGTILIYIHNGDNLVTAYINVDGLIDTLTSTTPYVNGESITSMVFYGSFSSMVFSVNADGSDPNIISIDIYGHNSVTGDVVKELSTQVVSCFEGTYNGTDSGTFNCIRFGNNVIGLGKSYYYPQFGTQTGNAEIIDDTFAVGSASSGAIFRGSFAHSDTCVGTWEYTTQPQSGAFIAVRTL